MVSFAELSVFDRILKLSEFKVKEYEFIEGLGIVLVVDRIEKKVACPRCGKKSDRLHQNHERLVRDLPMMEHDIFLKINRRQLKCKHCQKPFSEEFDSIRKTRNYTERLAEKVITEVIESDIKNVADRNGLSESEVETILKEKFSDLRNEKPQGIKKLGIDEIAWVKGQKNYCAVIVDLETRKPINILEKRTKECLRECFESWGAEILEQIEEVSIDLWSAYKNLVEELMPNAQVVADRFHVMKTVNDELDKERKLVKKQAEKLKSKKEKTKIIEGLKRSKYCLLKNRKDLDYGQKEKLKEIKAIAPKLIKMYGLKEKLRSIFESKKSETIAVLKLTHWLKKAAEYFPDSCGTIIRWF
ncbi:MAG: ISL3 family transposase, partial [Prochloraceae cyanobacterium]|nr:ISL3 family transposase [Prochloraceae cyanobacterium]